METDNCFIMFEYFTNGWYDANKSFFFFYGLNKKKKMNINNVGKKTNPIVRFDKF